MNYLLLNYLFSTCQIHFRLLLLLLHSTSLVRLVSFNDIKAPWCFDIVD